LGVKLDLLHEGYCVEQCLRDKITRHLLEGQ